MAGQSLVYAKSIALSAGYAKGKLAGHEKPGRKYFVQKDGKKSERNGDGVPMKGRGEQILAHNSGQMFVQTLE